MMNNQSKASSKDDAYCQLCSTLPATKNNKRLSSFFCDHCQLSLCYHCFEQHAKINKKDRSSAPPSQLAQIKDLFEKKRQLLSNFQEHCLRNLQSAFDEVFQDLENLRQESVSYVQQQFHDAEVSDIRTMSSVLFLFSVIDHSFRSDVLSSSNNIIERWSNQRVQSSIESIERSHPSFRDFRFAFYAIENLDLTSK